MSIIDKLRSWCREQPEKAAWTFLNDRGDPVDAYTYQELENSSNFLAEYLVNQSGLKSEDRVLLVFFPGLDFTVSLIACFKAKLIAVPVFPPDPRKLKKDLHHFVSIQESSGAKVALTNQTFNFVKKVEDIKNIFSSIKWPELKWIAIDDQVKKGKKVAASNLISDPDLDSIAFLQYTSGSTSEPKGVMISHRNLAHNLSMIIKELKADRETINVSWLPQYHDMGLIGSYLGVLYCGGKGYYMSPISFLKDPLLWIKSLSKYSGTHSQAPNFAFALVTRKFQEQSGLEKDQLNLNLSSVQHMINAAEPVDFKAIMDFYRTFEPYRLPDNVVVPTYGLAEHTVFVCSGGRSALTVRKNSLLERNRAEILDEGELSYTFMTKTGEVKEVDPAHEMKIVGCGFPGHHEGLSVVIASVTSLEDKENTNIPVTALRDLEVGEIWIDSDSKAQGYWQQAETSVHDFQAVFTHAKESNESDTRRYLRTGDMGFMYKGELFICGRIKDMIILGGSNHYPQDIEKSIEQALGQYIRPGCSAAIAIDLTILKSSRDLSKRGESKGESNSHAMGEQTGEIVIYLAELKDNVTSKELAEIAQKCVSVTSAEHGLSLRYVYLLPSRTIPKTTSGKIARSWCKKALLKNSLQFAYEYDSCRVTKTVAESKVPDQLSTNTKQGYEAVAQEDGPNIQKQARPIEHLPLESVRGMDHAELVYRLQSALQHILGNNHTSTLSDGKENFIDEHKALMALGVDSMNIVQFKGVVEKRFYCELPDEFFFSTSCNLHELAISVHEGGLTNEQKHKFQLDGNAVGTVDGNKVAPQRGPGVEAVGHIHKQPCCPWFTCCY